MSTFQNASISYRSRLFGGCAALSFAMTLGACAVGNVPTDPGTGDGPQRIASDEPGIDDRLDALGIICETTMTVTGSFVEGMAQPAELNGCWPVGTWTVAATVDRLGCDPQPMFTDSEFTESYVYEVSYDEEASTINVLFMNDPSDDRVNLKISTSGDSLCHGAMDHFALDGTVIGFRPTLQLDGTLQGIGTYTLYSDDTF
jgi:hypothetical protein